MSLSVLYNIFISCPNNFFCSIFDVELFNSRGNQNQFNLFDTFLPYNFLGYNFDKSNEANISEIHFNKFSTSQKRSNGIFFG